MKTALSVVALLGLVGALPVLAQAPVNDISTPAAQRRMPVSGGVAVDDGGSAQTYGTGADDSPAADSGIRPIVPAASNSESRPESRSSSSYASGNAPAGGEAGLYRQFQQLQEEVASLRGQLEEQAYQIQKLKQQQQDDFASLDRRLGAGGTAPSAAAADGGAAAGDRPSAAAKPAAAVNTDGQEVYEEAYGKLKAKDYDGAIVAFKAFVSKYPTSDYAASAWYWLGIVYQTKGDFDNAGKSFGSLIERFPDHAKTDDAKYNLGKIYHQQGKADKARVLLKEVAAGKSKSAPLAKTYLESM